MNFDDVMEDWRSQDAPPRQGLNEALLARTLRQEEAKFQQSRRRERWMIFGVTAFVVVRLARLLFVVVNHTDGIVLSGWDYIIPVVGGVAVLLWALWAHARQRTQAMRELRFGDSLRDQINRQLAQCDYAIAKTRSASRLGLRLLPIVGMMALFLARGRTHGWTFSDVRLWGPIVLLACWAIATFGLVSWAGRLLVQRRILPRKRYLEGLLKELDGQ